MIWIGYLILPLVWIHEMWYDRSLAEQFDIDGRSKEENDLMHKDQLPIRASVITLLTGIIVLMEFDSLLQWESILYLLNYGFYYWVGFDISVNIFWLDKPWYYAGTTWGPERKYKNRLWIIKFAGFFTTLIIYLS